MVAPGGYDSIVAAASRKYGVPESYIRSVMQVESGNRPDAVSSAGAGGLMQIMPATYREVAQREGLGDDRFDPQNNIFAGTAYLRENNDRFGGDWTKTFQAYNAGPARVERGGPLPRETQNYVPRVQAGIDGQGAGVTGYRTGYNGPGATYEAGPEFAALLSNIRRNGPPQDRRAPGTFADATGMDPQGEAELRAMIERERLNPPTGGGNGGLLGVDSTNNWMDGLGGLLGSGQTSSQPPGPQISPLQYQLAGAGNAVGQLAGVTNRRVGIGELLGALGGGLTQGAAAGQQAQRQQRADQRDERNDQFNNVYRAAMAQKALQPDRLALGDRFKVAGKRIFDAATQTWIDDPNASADQGGPLDGTGFDAQMTNVYVTLEQKRANGQPLTQQEQLLLGTAERHLNKSRMVAGPDGIVREVAPPPLPTLPRVGGDAPAPGPAAPPAPDLLGINTPSGGAPPPAQTATVTPSGSRVTEVVPRSAKEVPATMNSAMLGNVSSLRKVEDAITAINKAPDATGVAPALLNMLPFDAANRVMPGGTDARAKLADIGSLIIHDRSGAAVSIGEMEKLKPFIPNVSDDDATVQIKLGKLKQELSDILRDQATTFGPGAGYRANPVVEQFQKTGRAPRYEAPMSGGDAAGGGAPKVLRFDAQGNIIQ